MKSKTKIPICERYPEVLEKVKEGKSIQQALKDLKIDRSPFYKSINSAQKAELQIAKTKYKKYPSIKWIEITSAQIENALIADADKNNREYKAHIEYIIEQYAKGNIKYRIEGTDIWVGMGEGNKEIGE